MTTPRDGTACTSGASGSAPEPCECNDPYRAAPFAALAVDPDARVSFVNEAACRLLGRASASLLGADLRALVDERHREALVAAWERLWEGGEVERVSDDVDLDFRSDSGGVVPVHVSLSLEARSGGDRTCARLIVLDARRRRDAEERAARMRDDLSLASAELGRSARIKDEFLAATSHELRTPLTGILGMTEALLDGLYGELTPSQKRALGTVDESGRHLLALINDILDFSRAESGNLDLQIERASVRSICDSALSLVRESARRKSQRVQFSITPDDIEIEADPRRVTQMLVNLLGNASKFTAERGRIALEVSLEASAGVVVFTVSDDGVGIAPSDLPKLFRPFTQLDGALARRQAGTGLGLSLVQRMVELQGGSVHAESELGKGSRFSLRLPAASLGRGAPLSLRGTSAPHTELTGPSSGQPRRVLVVDDNELNLGFLVDFLRSIGHEISVARDGREAIEQVRAARPDVVLMDIQMPDVDGLEATRILRSDPDPAIASTRIVALTALALEGDRERALAAGVDEHMAKPVSLRRVKELIERLTTGAEAP
jgi:PAS domain S-box-containing protein